MSVHPITKPGEKRPFRHEVRWRENGKQRARRFRLKGDADAWDLEVTRRQQLGGTLAVQHLTVKGATLNTWIVERWGPQHGVNLEQSTRDRYAIAYKIHVEPWLGHLPLQELTVGRLREWQAQLTAAGVTAKSIRKARTFLSSVLRHAAESEAIQANPLSLVRAPKLPHTDAAIALSPRQVERLRRLLGPRDAMIVSLLAYSGVRPGEMRALRWGDVGTNTIHVERAANPDGTVKGTKTRRSRRNVRLLAPLAEDLEQWRVEHGGRGGQLIIPSTGGHAMTRDAWNAWRSHVWTPTAPRVLEHPAKPYDLRHSFASLLLAEGRSVHYVAEQLGHDANLTLGTYGHLIADYADSGNIDAEHEIRQARQEANGWSPPHRLPGDERMKIGSHQWRILQACRDADGQPISFDHPNSRRAAETLEARGLLTGDRGERRDRKYVLTPRGETITTEALDRGVFGLSSTCTPEGAAL